MSSTPSKKINKVNPQEGDILNGSVHFSMLFSYYSVPHYMSCFMVNFSLFMDAKRKEEGGRQKREKQIGVTSYTHFLLHMHCLRQPHKSI